MKYLFLLLVLAACGPLPEGRYAYVSNERDGTITVIDIDRDTRVRTFEVGGRPRGVRLSPDRSTLYVAVSSPAGKDYRDDDNFIAAVDARSGHIIRRYAAGSDPEQIALAGGFLYAANEDAGLTTIVDLGTGNTAGTVVVGIEPEGATASPDGRWVYITAETSNSVSVIDTRRNEVEGIFMVGHRPRDTAFSPDGTRAYVTAELGKSMSVVDVGSHRVLQSVVFEGDDTVKPVGVVTSPDGERIYVALGRANGVAVVDAATLRVLATLPSGKRVWGIGLSPDGRKLYAAGSLSNDVTVYDTKSLSIIQRLEVGDGPWGIAL